MTGPKSGNATEKDPSTLNSYADVGLFLLEKPLYQECLIPEHSSAFATLAGRFGNSRAVFDGTCDRCKQESTFELVPISIPNGDPWNGRASLIGYYTPQLKCTRVPSHLITYFLRLNQGTVTKVGQHPSLADLANEEVRRKYRSVLKGDNSAELYKAIGLAAHGEGIGSLVYLRRIFERLIESRFNEFKVAEGWDELGFSRMRMDEKVDLLREHLPASLVEIRRIYGIFSKGIHELENAACLKFFDIGKRSIIMILEDDLQKKIELEDRAELKKAIAAFEDR